jgi:hypothetical protein
MQNQIHRAATAALNAEKAGKMPALPAFENTGFPPFGRPGDGVG